MKSRKSRKPVEPKFDDRTRFNWGYHDAAHAVRQGWATAEKNFGFGPDFQLSKPADVMYKHPDPSYARGWMAGYNDATNGEDTSSSEAAWMEMVAHWSQV